MAACNIQRNHSVLTIVFRCNVAALPHRAGLPALLLSNVGNSIAAPGTKSRHSWRRLYYGDVI